MESSKQGGIRRDGEDDSGGVAGSSSSSSNSSSSSSRGIWKRNAEELHAIFGIPKVVAEVLIEEAGGSLEEAANVIIMRQRFGVPVTKAYETRTVNFNPENSVDDGVEEKREFLTRGSNEKNVETRDVNNEEATRGYVSAGDSKHTIDEESREEKGGSTSSESNLIKIEHGDIGEETAKESIRAESVREVIEISSTSEEEEDEADAMIKQTDSKHPPSVTLSVTNDTERTATNKKERKNDGFKKGDAVLARWQGGGDWYGATVVSVDKKTKTLSLAYYDGDRDRAVPAHHARFQPKPTYATIKLSVNCPSAAEEQTRSALENMWPMVQHVRVKTSAGSFFTQTLEQNEHLGGGHDKTAAKPVKRKYRTAPASEFVGVRWDRGWRVDIYVPKPNGARAKKYVGRFDDEIAAALAYDHAMRAKFGEDVVTNFDLSGRRNPQVTKENLWTSTAVLDGTSVNLGTFAGQIDAAIAHDVALIVSMANENEERDEMSRFNFPWKRLVASRATKVALEKDDDALPSKWQKSSLEALGLTAEPFVRVEVPDEYFVRQPSRRKRRSSNTATAANSSAKSYVDSSGGTKKSRQIPNAYAIFTKEMYSKVRAADDGLSYLEVFASVAKLWRGLSFEKKTEYRNRALRLARDEEDATAIRHVMETLIASITEA
eukprot:g1446.t1